MPKRTRALALTFIVTVAVGSGFAWLTSGPKIVGDLPREDIEAILALLGDLKGPGFFSALRKTDSQALIDRAANGQAGVLVRLEVRSEDRVLAFVTGDVPTRGRLLV